ncbi:MAG: SDR family oxidoreductase [Clostridiales bacterium]|jgi:short-subunit dehydrogenase|nr:SDR family oxidoreductase [Clostridiales bacterium]
MPKKVALITGASSGIGKEIAKIHATRGGGLVVVARREESLAQLKNELESKYDVQVKIIVKDLSAPQAALEIYNEVKEAGIEIDYLINNAGFGGQGLFHERALEDDIQMIQVNITVLTELTRLFIEDFIKRDAGKILNVSSTAALMPGPLQAVYYATKAYVTSFSNALSGEMKNTNKNITITALMPGAIKTEFAKTAGLDKTSMFAKTACPTKVAEDAYEGMLAGKLNVFSGLSGVQRMFLGLMKFMPKKAMMNSVYKMQMPR